MQRTPMHTLKNSWDMYLLIAEDGYMIGEELQPQKDDPQSLFSSDREAGTART